MDGCVFKQASACLLSCIRAALKGIDLHPNKDTKPQAPANGFLTGVPTKKKKKKERKKKNPHFEAGMV